MERIEIYTSKKKSLYLLLICLMFFAMGVWLFLERDSVSASRRETPIFVLGVSITLIILFGLGVFIFLKRLIRTEVALIVDASGVHLKPSEKASEPIKWEDIVGFEEVRVQTTKMLLVVVRNPQYWVDRETSLLKKMSIQINIKTYGAPFYVAASGLAISENQLNHTLNSYFDTYNKLSTC